MRGGAGWGRLALVVAFVWVAGCDGEGSDESGSEADAGAAVAGQTQASSLVGEAFGFVQAGNFAAAEDLLRSATEAEPENPQAWAMLGFSVHQQGRYEEALELHRKAAEFDATRALGLYRSGLALARLDRPDEAFEALEAAKATGTFEITQVGLSPDVESLRDDPRFAALFPTDAEFADPFAEDVEILHEWAGEAAGDQFGWIARNAGDVDGDGINDVTTSAPTWGADGSQAGKIYTYSGASGALLWEAVGGPGDQFGIGIEAAGDVNGDGIPDVVGGAPGGNYVQVHHGRTGEVLIRFDGAQEGEALGQKVSDLGDLNGDGFDDVMGGAPSNDLAGEDAGAVYVISGADGSVLHTWLGETAGANLGSAGGGRVAEDGSALVAIGAPGAGPFGSGRVYVYRGLEDEPAFIVESDEQGAALGGMFVSIVGDVDADGTRDVYASDWSHGGLGASTGRIHVHSGATGERLFTLSGEAAGDGFGIGPADAGDVDGDGHDDLVVGAWQHASLAVSGGKVYVHSGADASLMSTITGQVMGETLGFDATGMGDMNGDGVPEFLLTSAWSAINGARSGRVFVVSGVLNQD